MAPTLDGASAQRPAKRANPAAPPAARRFPGEQGTRLPRTAREPLPVGLVAGLQAAAGNRAVSGKLGRGARPLPRHPAPTVQRFEATVHQSAELRGLTTGGGAGTALSLEEAGAVYAGNWMRDVNQVFVPLVTDLLPADVAFATVSYMAAKKFGRIMTPEQFGYYIPSEHLDNPAGLTQSDVLNTPPAINSPPNVPGAPPRPAAAVTPQESVEPSGTVLGAPIFSVDQSGVMAFLRRSNLHIERRLTLAAQRGRNPEGMLHFGAALHAVEDLFAHSNWVEIAVNHTLDRRADLLPQLRGAERRAFTYTPEVDVGAGPQGRPGRRPVLTTGSFTGTDTQISVASEVVTFLRTPPAPPASDAEQEVERRFILAALRTVEGQLASNPTFRRNVRAAITEAGVPGAVADQALNLPLAQIYDFAHINLPIPEAWKEATTRRLRTVFRQAIWQQMLIPAAQRVEAQAVQARVADTSLIQFRRDSQRQGQGRFTPADKQRMETIARAGGPSVADQRTAARTSGAAHNTVLQQTPLPVLAGPSHSQISKDHPNSPFSDSPFGWRPRPSGDCAMR